MKLFNYQQEFVEHALMFYQNNDFLWLADEQGLGKTAQALSIIAPLKYVNYEIQKILIICPASLKINWQREVKMWTGHTAQILKVGEKISANIVIVNYDICGKPKLLGELMSFKPDLLILDEAHYLKSPTTQRTKAVLGSGRQAGIASTALKILALSGTPMPNKPIELYPMLKQCCPQAIPGMGYYEFAQKYCKAWNAPWGFDVSGADNLEELSKAIEPYMVRRLKADVLQDLPPKIYKVVVLDPDATMKKAVKLEKEFDRASIDPRKGIINVEGLATVRRMMGEAKVKKAVAYIEDLLQDVKKIVVFAHHADVIKMLKEGLKDYEPVVLTGSSTQTARQDAVDTFQDTEICRVFIGNIQAAGVGITLTAASHVVFVEPSWVPAELDQAADRCHRIGQKDNVTVEFLVVEGSLDEYILSKILDKKNVIDQVITPSKGVELTRQENGIYKVTQGSFSVDEEEPVLLDSLYIPLAEPGESVIIPTNEKISFSEEMFTTEEIKWIEKLPVPLKEITREELEKQYPPVNLGCVEPGTETSTNEEPIVWLEPGVVHTTDWIKLHASDKAVVSKSQINEKAMNAFVAEELQRLVPELVELENKNIQKDTKMIDKSENVPYAENTSVGGVNIMKLLDLIDTLEKTISEIRNELASVAVQQKVEVVKEEIIDATLVKATAKVFFDRYGKNEILKLLNAYGVSSLGQLPLDKYRDFYSAMKVVMDKDGVK